MERSYGDARIKADNLKPVVMAGSLTFGEDDLIILIACSGFITGLVIG